MKAIQLTPALYDYILQHCPMAHPALAELAAETKQLPGAQMQISPDQGSFLNQIVKLIGAKKVLELGCFTGYSAICMASALPKDGRLVTCDINPDTTKIAEKYFVKAGVADRITVKLGPALESIAALEKQYGAESFDMAFIDADKAGLQSYLTACLRLIRPNGLIAVDNVLWSGAVIEGADQSGSTVAIREFNAAVRNDKRVEGMLLNLSDGLYLLRKV